jgi:hypothetical protein
MIRYLIVVALTIAVLIGAPAGPARAQGDGNAPAIPQSPVTITATGSYADVVGQALPAAFDRAMQELDAASDQITPTEVKDATFRRRLLELRLLMDYGAFAYDPSLLDTFRKLVDNAYEEVGAYQDVDVIQELLNTQVRPDIVSERQIRMNVALASLRSQTVRSLMRDFLASPSQSIRGLDPNDVPLLWTVAQQVPTNDLDGIGNAALLGASALAGIQGSNPYVADVFDPVQEAHFHDTRKGIRSALLLMNMFPDLRGALEGGAETLFSMVSQYGDVNDAFTAYRIAPTLGVPQDASAAYLRDEFSKAQARQQAVSDADAFNATISALSQVQQQHRR